MKSFHWIAVIALSCAVCTGIANAAPRERDDDTPSSRTLGSANAEKWNKDDIKTMCQARWPDRPQSYDSCMERNKEKLGRNKNIADTQLLNEERERQPTKAAKRDKPSDANPDTKY